MLQIRLSKGGGGGASGDGGGSSAGRPPAGAETVTVACPEHLVLADLPVAKSLGAVTGSAVRSVGRRPRRHLGERVHFCVGCDFPIAIYGRLMPCEHILCLACARTDSNCFVCDERIQKIQTIKLTEEIYICGAPHCLVSFLKAADFKAHVHEYHAHLLHSNQEKEEANDNVFNTPKPSSATDAHKQSLQPEMSTARAPPRAIFSPSSNSQNQDREERTSRQLSRDPSPRVPQQLKPPPPFQSPQQPQSNDFSTENSPQNWLPPPPTGMPPETTFPNFPPLPHQTMNFSIPMNNPNHAFAPNPQFPFAPVENPPVPTSIAGFPEHLSRPQWGVGPMGVQFQPPQMGNLMDAQQAGVAFFQGFPMNPPLPGKELEQHGVSGVDQPLSLPPPLPLAPPPSMPPPLSQQQQQQLNRGRDFPPGFGWQNDNRGAD